MAESDFHAEHLALYELGELLEVVLDQGHPAFALRQDGHTWQILLGNPEGPAAQLERYGAMAPEVAHAMMRRTVDGLNVLVINDETYRFARATFRVEDRPATIFVPG